MTERRSAAATRAASPARSRTSFMYVERLGRRASAPQAAPARRSWSRWRSHARAAGKSGFTVEVKEDDPDSLAWIERRGFVEVERQKGLELDLADRSGRTAAAAGGRRRRPPRRRARAGHVHRSAWRRAGTSPASTPSTTRGSSSGARSRSGGRAGGRSSASSRSRTAEVVGFASVDVFGESDTRLARARPAVARGLARPWSRHRAEALTDRSRAPGWACGA